MPNIFGLSISAHPFVRYIACIRETDIGSQEIKGLNKAKNFLVFCKESTILTTNSMLN